MQHHSATSAYTFPTATPLPLHAAFDGGRLTSDGGLPWLSEQSELVIKAGQSWRRGPLLKRGVALAASVARL